MDKEWPHLPLLASQLNYGQRRGEQFLPLGYQIAITVGSMGAWWARRGDKCKMTLLQVVEPQQLLGRYRIIVR